jgi:hypothetical protein
LQIQNFDDSRLLKFRHPSLPTNHNAFRTTDGRYTCHSKRPPPPSPFPRLASLMHSPVPHTHVLMSWSFLPWTPFGVGYWFLSGGSGFGCGMRDVHWQCLAVGSRRILSVCSGELEGQEGYVCSRVEHTSSTPPPP